MPHRIGLATILTLLQALVCLSQEPASGPLFEEKLLAGAPDRVEVEECLFSPDGRRVMFVGKGPEGRHVYVDGVRGEPTQRTRMLFSEDGRRAAYVARMVDKEVLVDEGRPGERLTAIPELQLSRDGSVLAYVARNGDRRHAAVIDGKPGDEFEAVGGLGLSPDGKRHGYYAKLPNGKWAAVIDGKRGEEFDELGPGPVRFSPDGKQAAYQAMVGRQRLLVINGRRGPLFLSTSMAFWSPDSRKLAYSVSWSPSLTVLRGCMILDGKQQMEFQDVGAPIFSPDGKRLAYLVLDAPGKEGEQPKSSWFVDGKRIGGGDLSNQFFFSTDGKHYAFPMSIGSDRHAVILDGRRVATEEMRIRDVVLSRDAGSFALVGHIKAKWRIAWGDQSCEGLDEVRHALFTDDGRTLAFSARIGPKFWRKVIRKP